MPWIILLALGAAAWYVGRPRQPASQTPAPTPRGFRLTPSGKLESATPSPDVPSTDPVRPSPMFSSSGWTVTYERAGRLSGGYVSGWGVDVPPVVVTGIVTHPGDVEILVIDTEPEKDTWGAGDSAEAYCVLATNRIPDQEDAWFLRDYNVDKRVGGTDMIDVVRDDLTTRKQKRERGELWMRGLQGRVLYCSPRDWWGEAAPLKQIQNIAEIAAGGQLLPYLCCRCRHDRTPARKQIELIRMAKCHKRWDDVVDVYAPLFFDVADLFFAFAGPIGEVAGIPAMIWQDAMTVCKELQAAGIEGRDVGWHDAKRVLLGALDVGELGAATAGIKAALSTEVKERVLSNVAAVNAATGGAADIITELGAAAYAANVEMPLYQMKQSWASGGSPSVVGRVTVFT